MSEVILPSGSVPWSGRQILKAVGGGLLVGVVLLVPIFLAGLMDAPLPRIGAIAGLVTYGAVLLSTWFFIFRKRSSDLAALHLTRPGPTLVFQMLLLTVAILIAEGLVITVLSSVAGDLPTGSEQILGTDSISLSPLDGVLLGFVVVVLGPFVEEVLFRGLLLQWLAARKPEGAAILITSAVFAIAHGFSPLVVTYFLLGLAISLVMVRTRNLTAAVLVHGFHNLAAFAVIAAAAG